MKLPIFTQFNSGSCYHLVRLPPSALPSLIPYLSCKLRQHSNMIKKFSDQEILSRTVLHILPFFSQIATDIQMQISHKVKIESNVFPLMGSHQPSIPFMASKQILCELNSRIKRGGGPAHSKILPEGNMALALLRWVGDETPPAEQGSLFSTRLLLLFEGQHLYPIPEAYKRCNGIM